MISLLARSTFALFVFLWIAGDAGGAELPASSQVATSSSFPRRVFLVLRICLQLIRLLSFQIFGAHVAAFFSGRNAAAIALKCFHQSQGASGLQGALLSLQAVNASRAAPELAPQQIASIFLGAAIHFVALTRGRFSFVSSVLLGLAREANPREWSATPAGTKFIQSGKWADFCRPVSHEIKKAFGTASLAVVLESLLTGRTTDEQESLRTLLACESSEDASGALLAGVLIANRAGDHATATQRLASIDALRGGLQRAIATLLHAGQAVASTVDPAMNTAAAEACRQATGLLRPATLAGPRDMIASLWLLIGWRQLFAVRVAYIRMHQSVDERDTVLEATLLAELQGDLAFLRPLANDPRYACLVQLYSAVARSLTQSRALPTRHLFMESMKAARRCGFAYDEGLALLEMCICLRAAMPAATLRAQLERAMSIFQSVGAADELESARCLLGLAAI